MAPLTSILQIFSQSPIQPLQKHMRKVYDCVAALLPFFQAVMDSNWNEAERLQKEVVGFENEADDLKKKLRLHLSKRLSLPVSRSDLLELIHRQDQVANKAKDIAGLVIGRHMNFSSEIAPLYLQLLERCIEAARQALDVTKELAKLLETGFRGTEIKIMEDKITELDNIEQSTDKMQIEIRHILFGLEKELPPIDIIFLYKVIEWTGDLADLSHGVGGQLYLLLAR